MNISVLTSREGGLATVWSVVPTQLALRCTTNTTQAARHVRIQIGIEEGK